MKTVKSIVEQHWRIGIGMFIIGFFLGIVAYFYAYKLAIDGIEKRKIESKVLSSASIYDSNIRGKGMPILVAVWHLNPTIMEVKSMTKKEAMVKLKGVWRTAQSTTKMKAVKDLYAEVKGLDILDTAQIPASIEQKVSNV